MKCSVVFSCTFSDCFTKYNIVCICCVCTTSGIEGMGCWDVFPSSFVFLVDMCAADPLLICKLVTF
jgi:hypothetical protein